MEMMMSMTETTEITWKWSFNERNNENNMEMIQEKKQAWTLKIMSNHRQIY